MSKRIVPPADDDGPSVRQPKYHNWGLSLVDPDTASNDTGIELVQAKLREHGSTFAGGQDWQCPAHDDQRASLGVKVGRDGKVVLNCQAGCETKAVVAALGLKMGDLFPARGEIVATYPYVDEAGELLFEVVREHPKKFWQRGADGKPSVKDIRRVPYRLPEIRIAAAYNQTVHIPEGEKDVEALEAAGEIATCNPGGAGKWRDEYSETLRGTDVVVIADRDPAGYKHAQEVAASLRRFDVDVRIAAPIPTHLKADVFDHLAAGYTVADLVTLTDEDLAELIDGTSDAGSPEPDGAEVQRRLADLRVAARAKELFAAEEAARHPRPQPVMGTLRELLARPEPPFRIAGLLPSRGRMTIVAQRKTGKTTLKGNLYRSLLSGEPFLGMYEAQKLDGRIVDLNFEMSIGQHSAWMAEMGIDPDRLYVINMRGQRNLLSTEAGREELAEIIRAQDGEVVGVDPFGRAFTGKNQDAASEVTPWLVQLDEAVEHSGASELILLVHAGWDAERSRGSSALEDWPDVIVTMTEEYGSRFIRAEGRDVAVGESQLAYDPATRLLSLTGGGSRADVHDTDILARALPVIKAAGAKGISPTAVRDALHINKSFSMARLLERHSKLGAEIESTPNPSYKTANLWRSLDYIGQSWEEAK